MTCRTSGPKYRTLRSRLPVPRLSPQPSSAPHRPSKHPCRRPGRTRACRLLRRRRSSPLRAGVLPAWNPLPTRSGVTLLTNSTLPSDTPASTTMPLLSLSVVTSASFCRVGTSTVGSVAVTYLTPFDLLSRVRKVARLSAAPLAFIWPISRWASRRALTVLSADASDLRGRAPQAPRRRP